MTKVKKNKKEITELPKTQSATHVVVNVKPTTKDNICELPGYEKEDFIVSTNSSSTISNSVCWNCCHSIKDTCISQPLKYENGVFTTTGNFCSYPCVSRYIIDGNEPTEVIFSKLSTLNLYVNIMCGTKGVTISPAPPRLVLDIFGGTISIDEYRLRHTNYLTTAIIEPIVKYVDVSIKELYIKNMNTTENKKEFKLYRKNKKTNTNDIYSSMNLISE